ncbi:hypothetical protein GCM10009563_23410 [Subtercola frigoramans]
MPRACRSVSASLAVMLWPMDSDAALARCSAPSISGSEGTGPTVGVGVDGRRRGVDRFTAGKKRLRRSGVGLTAYEIRSAQSQAHYQIRYQPIPHPHCQVRANVLRTGSMGTFERT